MAKTPELDMNKAPKHIHQENVDVPTEGGRVIIPQIKLLQGLSPELDKDDEKYIKGATAGDMVITDGDDVQLVKSETGILFYPVAVKRIWTEWIPRDQGGGFVASYDSREEMEAGVEKGNDVNVSIDYLVACPEIKQKEEMGFYLLSFNSTTKMIPAKVLAGYIKKYKTMSGVQYRLKSSRRENKAKQKFYNYDIEVVGWTGKTDYMAIEAVKEHHMQKFLPLMDEA